MGRSNNLKILNVHYGLKSPGNDSEKGYEPCFYLLIYILISTVSVSFAFLKPKKHGRVSQAWNVFMWITLIVGNGLLMCLYSQEWFAIQNCPRKGVSITPRKTPWSNVV